jgi:hypothetical protein
MKVPSHATAQMKNRNTFIRANSLNSCGVNGALLRRYRRKEISKQPNTS